MGRAHPLPSTRPVYPQPRKRLESMPRATCRCGQVLSVPVNGPERVVCPTCSAKIRVRRATPKLGKGDGFIRFFCPCGRKLKVRVVAGAPMPTAGKCPDCGEVVPVPEEEPKPSSSAEVRASSTPNYETPTEELSTVDMEALEAWRESHSARPHRLRLLHVPTPRPHRPGLAPQDPPPAPRPSRATQACNQSRSRPPRLPALRPPCPP